MARLFSLALRDCLCLFLTDLCTAKLNSSNMIQIGNITPVLEMSIEK
jgi:hypothetical protein